MQFPAATSAASFSYSSSTRWTLQENQIFEKALALVPENMPDRWQMISHLISSKSPAEVSEHYHALVLDTMKIEQGQVALAPQVTDHYETQFSPFTSTHPRRDNIFGPALVMMPENSSNLSPSISAAEVRDHAYDTSVWNPVNMNWTGVELPNFNLNNSEVSLLEKESALQNSENVSTVNIDWAGIQLPSFNSNDSSFLKTQSSTANIDWAGVESSNFTSNDLEVSFPKTQSSTVNINWAGVELPNFNSNDSEVSFPQTESSTVNMNWAGVEFPNFNFNDLEMSFPQRESSTENIDWAAVELPNFKLNNSELSFPETALQISENASTENMDWTGVEFPNFISDGSDVSISETESAMQISEIASTSRNSVAGRKKGRPWTKEEHIRFLIGLLQYERGDWRNISRKVVVTRTPSQVASHAQKYFLRQDLPMEQRKRPSIHDITIADIAPLLANQNQYSPPNLIPTILPSQPPPTPPLPPPPTPPLRPPPQPQQFSFTSLPPDQTRLMNYQNLNHRLR